MLENLQPSTSLSSEEDQFYLEALAMFQKVQSFFCFLTIYDGSQISEHLLGPEQLTKVSRWSFLKQRHWRVKTSTVMNDLMVSTFTSSADSAGLSRAQTSLLPHHIIVGLGGEWVAESTFDLKVMPLVISNLYLPHVTSTSFWKFWSCDEQQNLKLKNGLCISNATLNSSACLCWHYWWRKDWAAWH